ncbi:MAG TPA: MFS transporter [Firmicutes bacterium]|nr:MFS transporter [Bacillota bacterium]
MMDNSSKSIPHFTLSVIVTTMVTIMIRINVPLYANHLGASPLVLGVIVGSAAFIPIFLAIPIGAMVRGDEEANVFWGGCALLLAASLAGGFVSRPGLLIGVQILTGIGYLALMVGLQSYVASLSHQMLVAGSNGADAGANPNADVIATATVTATATATGNTNVNVYEANFGRYTALAAIGELVGPLLGGMVADRLGFRAVFPAAAILIVLPMVAALVFPSKNPSPFRRNQFQLPRSRPRKLLGPQESQGSQRCKAQMHIAALLSDRRVMMAIVSSSVAILAFETRQTFYPVYVQGLGFSATFVGMLASVFALATLVVRPLIPYFISLLHGTVPLLLTGLALSSVWVAAVPLQRGPLTLILGSILMGSSIGIINPLGMAMATQATPDAERGVVIGVRLMMNRVFMFATPVIMGLVAKSSSIGVSFVVAGGLVALATVVVKIMAGSGTLTGREAEPRQGA